MPVLVPKNSRVSTIRNSSYHDNISTKARKEEASFLEWTKQPYTLPMTSVSLLDYEQFLMAAFKQVFPQTNFGLRFYDELHGEKSSVPRSIPLEILFSPLINSEEEEEASCLPDASAREPLIESSEDDESSDNDDYNQLLRTISDVKSHISSKRRKDAEELIRTIERPQHVTEEHIARLRTILGRLRLMLAPKERWRAKPPGDQLTASTASRNLSNKQQDDGTQRTSIDTPVLAKRKRGRPRKTQIASERRRGTLTSPKKRTRVCS